MYSVYASTCAFLTFLTRHKQTTDYSIASDGQRPAKDLALLAKLHPVIPILCKDLMVYPVPLGFEMFLLLLWRKNPMEMEGAPIFQRPLKMRSCLTWHRRAPSSPFSPTEDVWIKCILEYKPFITIHYHLFLIQCHLRAFCHFLKPFPTPTIFDSHQQHNLPFINHFRPYRCV